MELEEIHPKVSAVALFHPDTNARSMLVSSRTHLHYPSQKQWLPGIRGKKGTTAQSPSRCSDVLPPSRMRSANNVLASEPSLLPSSSRRARRRDPGKAKDSTFQGPSSRPRESPSTGFDFESTRSNHGKTHKRCIWLRCANEVREVLEQDQRTNRFDLKNIIKTTQVLLTIPQCANFFQQRTPARTT